jgi:hypothetical protein
VRGGARRAHGLVATHAGGEIDGMGIKPLQFHALFGASDKERSGLNKAIKTDEIQVAPIHDIERARLENKFVEPVDLVNIAGRDVDRGGERSPQIEQDIDFDRRIGRAKMRPGKHA